MANEFCTQEKTNETGTSESFGQNICCTVLLNTEVGNKNASEVRELSLIKSDNDL